MEFISGPITIKKIFLHNDNWFNFFSDHSQHLRPAITENVAKLLACRTPLLGFHLYVCHYCISYKKIPHSCKSRFCSSCGKAATDAWINTALNTLPNVRYQHITFTMPDEFWNLFRTNRQLLSLIPSLAANIVLDICKKGKNRKHYLPGIFLALHSYGRDLKFNVHIHLCTTVGGFSVDKPEKYINGTTIDHLVIKSMWRYQMINLLRNQFKSNQLVPYPQVAHHFKNLTSFNKWLNEHYQKTWVVYLQKTQNDAKITVNYLGKYLKKPPLAETRINSYDGQTVSFSFLDHPTHTFQKKSLPVVDFIKALICHIPDKNFRMIRYFGFLANRVRTTYLKRLNPKHQPGCRFKLSHLTRFMKAFHQNPLKCTCGAYFKLSRIFFAISTSGLVRRHNLKAAAFGFS